MILQSIKKEFILVFTDLHSVAVLLLMPVIFMLIMTFAMSERQDDMIQNLAVEFKTNNEYEQILFGRYLTRFGYQLTPEISEASASLVLESNLKQQLFASQNIPLIQIEYGSSSFDQSTCANVLCAIKATFIYA